MSTMSIIAGIVFLAHVALWIRLPAGRAEVAPSMMPEMTLEPA